MRNTSGATKDNRTPRRRLGNIGENIACMFLEKHGFKVIERNYLRKWGEIDIITKKGSKIHFIEVKSVSYDTSGSNVSSETLTKLSGVYRPEENLHPMKLRRLYRTIELYLLHKKLDPDWQLDLVTVKMNMSTRLARVEIFENIVL